MDQEMEKIITTNHQIRRVYNLIELNWMNSYNNRNQDVIRKEKLMIKMTDKLRRVNQMQINRSKKVRIQIYNKLT